MKDIKLFEVGRLRVSIAWYDLWIGLFIDANKEENVLVFSHTFNHLEQQVNPNTMKDKEYWKTVINGITPFEASMLVEAIYEDHDLRHEKEFRNYELVDIVSDLDTNDLAFLIKELAMREEIVDALKKAYETEWCISGKEVLKKLLEKRKQLLLQLNPINA